MQPRKRNLQLHDVTVILSRDSTSRLFELYKLLRLLRFFNMHVEKTSATSCV